MIYVDTSVIVSYIDEADPNHGRAVELVEAIRDHMIVSSLTLVELVSVFSRAGYENPIALALYSIRSIKAEVSKIDFNEVLNLAVKFAPVLKLKTLDLLHVVACWLAGCKRLATFDKELAGKSEVIARTLGIEVVY